MIKDRDFIDTVSYTYYIKPLYNHIEGFNNPR